MGLTPRRSNSLNSLPEHLVRKERPKSPAIFDDLHSLRKIPELSELMSVHTGTPKPPSQPHEGKGRSRSKRVGRHSYRGHHWRSTPANSPFPGLVHGDPPIDDIRRPLPSERASLPSLPNPSTDWIVYSDGAVGVAVETVTLRSGQRLRRGCPYCGIRHLHGVGEGHRRAHCSEHPWAGHGYYLLPSG